VTATVVRQERCDLLIVGGGINGCGIARDAAGRGLKVLVCEQDDLAAHTSSASTKLIHGGLRYLEYYEFGLVRKALRERELLLAAAPHIMWPLRFVMPHDSHLRPAWLIRLGLFLYDHLARRERLPGSTGIDLHEHPAGAALDPRFDRGFEYSDGWVDDARLVVLNALDARERGATVLTQTRCESVRRDGGEWLATLRAADGSPRQTRARIVVNATGPWASRFLRNRSPIDSDNGVRLVRGSHVLVPALFDHGYAYIFQGPDGRIIFAIPFERNYTLIGTTDVEHADDPDVPARITEDEVDYLCRMINRYFRAHIEPADVVWRYSGVRPLLNDRSPDAPSVTRDYMLELDTEGAPLLSVFGGKLTTYRKLAEEVVDRLAPLLGSRQAAWTAQAPLPGGDLPGGSFEAFLAEARERWPWLPDVLRERLARAYGTRMRVLLDGANGIGDLGAEVLPGLFEREIGYLRREEWARTAGDILWRRSKLGLGQAPGAAGRLDEWLTAHPTG
jgi:glycerol-3-phosphate dehydrogenase